MKSGRRFKPPRRNSLITKHKHSAELKTQQTQSTLQGTGTQPLVGARGAHSPNCLICSACLHQMRINRWRGGLNCKFPSVTLSGRGMYVHSQNIYTAAEPLHTAASIHPSIHPSVRRLLALMLFSPSKSQIYIWMYAQLHVHAGRWIWSRTPLLFRSIRRRI